MDIQLISTGLTNLDPGYYRSLGVHASTLLDRICRRLGHYEHKIDKATGERVPISDRNRELGQAFEHSIAQRVQSLPPDHPGLPCHGPFIHNPEILCDGIYITPDLVTGVDRVSWSIKLTWMSAARGPDDVKMWKYLEQLKAELHALRRVAEGTAQIRPAALTGDNLCWQGFRVDCPECGGRGWLIPAPNKNQPLEVEICRLCNGSCKVPQPINRDDYLTGLLTVCFVNDWRPEKEQIPTWRLKFWPEELAMTWAMMREEKEMVEAEESTT